jgi:excisionase family DNA binding protein
METDEMSASNDAKRADRARDAWRDVFTDALDLKTAAERLHVSSVAVDDMIHRGELVAVRLGGAWLLPAWQFTAEGVLPGVRRVLERWPGSTVTLSVWACTPSGDLRGRTPAQALEDSDVADVTNAVSQRSRNS